MYWVANHQNFVVNSCKLNTTFWYRFEVASTIWGVSEVGTTTKKKLNIFESINMQIFDADLKSVRQGGRDNFTHLT